MSLLTFSKPMYNKSIMPNVDDSKDMYVLIKSTTLTLIPNTNLVLTNSALTKC